MRNMLTYEELKELNVRLQKMNEETPAMREKQKADALMENEMHHQLVEAKLVWLQQLSKLHKPAIQLHCYLK